MKKVNFGVVGLKGIGQTHIEAVKAVEEAELVAVADIDEDVGKAVASRFNVECYVNYEEMLGRKDVDVVAVCTPHFLHAPMALKAVEHGKHVLVEKPMAVSVVEADQMIDMAKRRNVKLGVVYQYRFQPLYQEMKRIIKEGELGPIMRVCMEACTFRTQAYYNSDPWRGKWATEGGGVLINQTIHNLDLLQWFVGKPSKLQGWISTMLHDIEVEDIASSTIIFENGAHGVVQVSTIDAVPTERIEIYGGKAKIVNVGGELKIGLLEKSVRECISEDAVWGKPQFRWMDVEMEKEGAGHAGVIKDFSRSILEDRHPMVPGEEGRISLEIANAIILSSFEDEPVKFPISREKYAQLTEKLRQK